MKTLAIVILVVGILMTVFTGFTLITKKKVVDIGALEINKNEHTPIYWSPITGIVLIGVGAGLFLFSRQKK